MGVLALGGVGAYFIHQNAAETQKKMAEQEVEARRLAEEEAKLDRQLKEQQAKIDRLLAQLPTAKDETARAAVQRQLEEARSEMNALRTGDRARRPLTPSVGPWRTRRSAVQLPLTAAGPKDDAKGRVLRERARTALVIRLRPLYQNRS
jgi:septal ring factor EnvC (AmiA/AmiB activator)